MLRWSQLFTFTRDRAATVSVAHNTAAKSITSDVLSNPPKMNSLNRTMKPDSIINEIRVPITPKKLIIPKFSKKSDLRRL